MSELTQDEKSKLTRGLVDGDREAFKSLFTAYQQRVFRFFWLKLASIEAAEDLTQETFYRLWQGRLQVNPNKNLETLLFRIASNLVTDYIRIQKRRRELNADFPPEQEMKTADSDAEYHQIARIVDKSIAALPDAQRTAFVLSRYEGMSHRQVAEVMEISLKTVEKHISRALKTLQSNLASFDLKSPK